MQLYDPCYLHKWLERTRHHIHTTKGVILLRKCNHEWDVFALLHRQCGPGRKIDNFGDTIQLARDPRCEITARVNGGYSQHSNANHGRQIGQIQIVRRVVDLENGARDEYASSYLHSEQDAAGNIFQFIE